MPSIFGGIFTDDNVISGVREYPYLIDTGLILMDLIVSVGIAKLLIWPKSRQGLPLFYTIGLTIIVIGLLWQTSTAFGRVVYGRDLFRDWSLYAAKDVGIAFIYFGNLLYRRKLKREAEAEHERDEFTESREKGGVVEKIMLARHHKEHFKNHGDGI